jgi:hypothetical protein
MSTNHLHNLDYVSPLALLVKVLGVLCEHETELLNSVQINFRTSVKALLVSFLPFLFRWPILLATQTEAYKLRKVVAATKLIQTVTNICQNFRCLTF